MPFDLAEHLFIFVPVCSFSTPATQCSSGWILYVLIFIATVVFYRSLVVSLVVWTAFLLAAITSQYGLPWYEATFHSIVGCLMGILVLYSCDFQSPSFFPKTFFDNILGFFSLLGVGFILLLTQAGLDVTIKETGSPYGLFVSFILALVWGFLVSTVIFCIKSMDNQSYLARHYYVRMWASFFTVLILVYLIAPLPHANSYIKSFLSLAIATVLLVLYQQLCSQAKHAIE